MSSFLISTYFNNFQTYNEAPMLFTESSNTTNSIKGRISGIDFMEQDLLPRLECKGNIVCVKCKYGQKFIDGYVDAKAKTNRGRKKKERVKKYRKKIGVITSFQSMIMFVIRREYAGKEKRYKFLLFRNGKFTLTGVPSSVEATMNSILGELTTYLQAYFTTTVKLDYYHITSRNFKFQSIAHNIDLVELHKLYNNLKKDCVIFNKQTFLKFMEKPIFHNEKTSPFSLKKWNQLVQITDVDSHVLKDYLEQNFDKKHSEHENFWCKLDRLTTYVNNFKKTYTLYLNILKHLSRTCNDNNFNELLLKTMVESYWNRIKDEIMYADENILRSVDYDTEKYQGFVIKIFSPVIFDPKKHTTLTLFYGGKMNINGANNAFDAKCLYMWLNHFLHRYRVAVLYNMEEIYENMSDEEPCFTTCLTTAS